MKNLNTIVFLLFFGVSHSTFAFTKGDFCPEVSKNDFKYKGPSSETGDGAFLTELLKQFGSAANDLGKENTLASSPLNTDEAAIAFIQANNFMGNRLQDQANGPGYRPKLDESYLNRWRDAGIENPIWYFKIREDFVGAYCQSKEKREERATEDFFDALKDKCEESCRLTNEATRLAIERAKKNEEASKSGLSKFFSGAMSGLEDLVDLAGNKVGGGKAAQKGGKFLFGLLAGEENKDKEKKHLQVCPVACKNATNNFKQRIIGQKQVLKNIAQGDISGSTLTSAGGTDSPAEDSDNDTNRRPLRAIGNGRISVATKSSGSTDNTYGTDSSQSESRDSNSENITPQNESQSETVREFRNAKKKVIDRLQAEFQWVPDQYSFEGLDEEDPDSLKLIRKINDALTILSADSTKKPSLKGLTFSQLRTGSEQKTGQAAVVDELSFFDTKSGDMKSIQGKAAVFFVNKNATDQEIANAMTEAARRASGEGLQDDPKPKPNPKKLKK